MNNFKSILLILTILLTKNLFGQTKVAITIDDVPNAAKFKKDNFNAKLLEKLDLIYSKYSY